MISFDYILHLLTPDKTFCRELKQIIGFYPRNPAVYHEAFRHRSLNGNEREGEKQNNERLEFLGDAILSSVVAEILYRKFPQQHEGFLTKARSAIVQRSTLNHVAAELGINALIQTSIGTPAHNSFVLGNALEALIGAISVDRGYAYCFRFIDEKVIRRFSLLENAVREDTNYKSRLIEFCQKHQYPIEFITVNETISDGSPLFESIVSICGIQVCTGKGYTKKESHQQAASRAMQLLHSSQELPLLLREKSKQLKEPTKAESDMDFASAASTGSKQSTASS